MQWLLFSAAGVCFVLFVLVAGYAFYRPKRDDAVQNQSDTVQAPDDTPPEQDDGWTLTGRIDFAERQSMGGFVLNVEETQVAESIGGIEHRKIRWRKATLDEAKKVITTYHAHRNIARSTNYVVTSSIPLIGRSDVQAEHHGIQSWNRETSDERTDERMEEIAQESAKE
jgi:hypothetical protein